jgi:hypothetical protein
MHRSVTTYRANGDAADEQSSSSVDRSAAAGAAVRAGELKKKTNKSRQPY